MALNWEEVKDLSSDSFSALINTSGRQRMLSQRIVMLILHCQQLRQDNINILDSESFQLLTDTINVFNINHTDLINGNVEKNLPGLPSDRLHKKLYEDGAEKLIVSFIKRVEGLKNQLENNQLIETEVLNDFVSHTANNVLTCLNEITLIYEAEFHDFSEYQKKEIETQSEKVLKAIKSIKKISHQTDIISINSKIIASRAGEAGVQFKVIANRLQDLNKDIESSSDEIINYLELILGQPQ